ncbi:MAG: dephospho-CoA kinase [Planctomycetaceae bacterium]|nr:dephospho-CoA kinase [Planctomycetaceae bacterium]
MLILGLVGGVASGKSFVAECFRQLGAAVLDADKTGHAVLYEPAIMDAIRGRWGDGVLDAQGNVNRSAVAKIVFAPGNDAEKRFLEELTHPRIEARLQRQMELLQASGSPPLAVVIDAALLFEAGWDKLCDKIVFVDASRDIRLERAVARGWSAEQFAAREAAQLPLEEKRNRSHIVIRNARSRDNVREVVRLTWEQLFPESSTDA